MGTEQQVVQNVAFFSPASYNLPHFKFSHLPQSEVRGAWTSWIRWFENVMTASNIFDGNSRKAQMLAMGGIELQNVFYGIPGADDDNGTGFDSYVEAKKKLEEHFSPKHHECFERFQFWTMVPEVEEPIEKFLLRVQQKAEKCSFGKSEIQCRQFAIVDKIIQNAPEDLRCKLLEKQNLTMDDCIKLVNAHQSIKYQAAQMKPKSSTVTMNSSQVNRLTVTRSGLPQYRDSGIPAHKAKCLRCGRFKHESKEKCPAYDKSCHKCGRIGHFQTMCRGGRNEGRNHGRNVRK